MHYVNECGMLVIGNVNEFGHACIAVSMSWVVAIMCKCVIACSMAIGAVLECLALLPLLCTVIVASVVSSVVFALRFARAPCGQQKTPPHCCDGVGLGCV